MARVTFKLYGGMPQYQGGEVAIDTNAIIGVSDRTQHFEFPGTEILLSGGGSIKVCGWASDIQGIIDAANAQALDQAKPRISKLTRFENGLTVKQLKDIVKHWPECDNAGEPCEVWLGIPGGLSVQASEVSPLNYRSEGGNGWADLILSA